MVDNDYDSDSDHGRDCDDGDADGEHDDCRAVADSGDDQRLLLAKEQLSQKMQMLIKKHE